MQVFLPLSDVTPGGQPASRFILESDGRLELHDRTKDEIILSEVAPVSDDLGQKQGIGISAHDTD